MESVWWLCHLQFRIISRRDNRDATATEIKQNLGFNNTDFTCYFSFLRSIKDPPSFFFLFFAKTTAMNSHSPQLIEVVEDLLLGGQKWAELLLTGRVHLRDKNHRAGRQLNGVEGWKSCVIRLCAANVPVLAWSLRPSSPPRRWWQKRIAVAHPRSWPAAGAAVWSPGGSGSGLQTPDGSPDHWWSHTSPQLETETIRIKIEPPEYPGLFMLECIFSKNVCACWDNK